MNPDFYNDLPNGERDANALDRALDEFVRGRRRQVNRLEPELATTIDRMFALAEVSGMNGAIHTRPARRLLPWKAGIPMKQVVSVISTVAAVVILAIGINASVPGFRDQHAGLGTAVPTSDAEDGYQVSIAPLAPSDCNVEPRNRNEVVNILSVAQDSDWYGMSDGPNLIDERTFRDLDEVLRQWQACRDYGQTFEWLNLVSSNYLRSEVYGMRFPRPIYSSSTLNEIIDGWVTTDELRHPDAEGSFGGRLLIVRNLESSPELTGNTRIDISVDILDTISGEIVDKGYVVFVYEQESWRISIVGVDSDRLLEIDGPICYEAYCGYSPSGMAG
jgi:hypothetical protein